MYTHLLKLEENRIPKTITLTIRLKTELREKVEHYSRLLRLPPSSLCALVLEEKLEEWVKEYATRVYDDVSKL
ncbi:MAG: hypothetical protein ACFFCQ_02425 [Promethearchaeota archaeon]